MTEHGRILVVDDEIQIRRALSRALTSRGYLVEAIGEGEGAEQALFAFAPDLIVLDLNLPGISGQEVCRRIRLKDSVPILVLSVRSDESDKVEALDLGADDYLTKPFGIDEMLARVRALLRRTSPPAGMAQPRRFEARDVVIDLDERRVLRDGLDVGLTKTEWALLETLSAHPGRLMTHRWLLSEVWGRGYEEDVEVLRVFVSQLRKKVEPDPQRPSMILTDPGVGYRWTAKPVEPA